MNEQKFLNIIDYVYKYSDYSFSEKPFNDADNTVLAEIVYLHFENSKKPFKKMGFDEFLNCYFNSLRLDEYNKETFWNKMHLYLALACISSKRYSSITVEDFAYKFDEEDEIQFACVLFKLEDNSLLFSFRGTDSSLLGWKEDFNMIYMDETSGQKESRRYLKEKLKEYKGYKFRTCGHSKGGNLAVFSCLDLDIEELNNLINIYSNDGPGLHKRIYNSISYKVLEKKIIHIVPSSSIIGMLLHHFPIAYSVAYDEKNVDFIHCHDAYSWQIEDDHFLLKDRNALSYYLEVSLLELAESLSYEDRKIFVDRFFKTIDKLGFMDANSILSDFTTFLRKISIEGLREARKDKKFANIVRTTISIFRKNWKIYVYHNKRDKVLKK